MSNTKIGEHPDVTRFVKGVSSLRPTRPKYSLKWDVPVALDYLDSMDTVRLKELTLKTVTLLPLSTAQRAQTLTKININNIKNDGDAIIIIVPDSIKTSGLGRFKPCLKLLVFKEKPNLCVASNLRLYLKKREKLRDKCSQLFISTREPHKAVETSTISRWIKKVLKGSCIDTSVFSAHLTRHVATSAAADRSVDFDTIRLSAGWSERSQMFAQFYKRPIVSDGYNFASAVLNK